MFLAQNEGKIRMGVRKGRPRTVSRVEDPPANGQPQLRVRVPREAAAWVETQGGSNFLRGLILGAMFFARPSSSTYAHPAAHTEDCCPVKRTSGQARDSTSGKRQPADLSTSTTCGEASTAPTDTPADPKSRFEQAHHYRKKPMIVPLPSKGENNAY